MTGKHLLYIIGEPGAGKSTLVEELTRGLPYEETTSPFAMRRYDAGPLELGRRRPDFPGTDALSMSVQPVVVRFMEAVRPSLVLGEGDRLGNGVFFREMRNLGYDVQIVYLDAEGVAAERRARRGSDQNATWLRGRRSKALSIALTEPCVAWLDASQSPAALADLVGGPVADALRAARPAASAIS